MIKCPHCGSTAQVKINDKAILSRNKEWLSLPCECGCGCQFDLEYQTKEYSECNINTIEKIPSCPKCGNRHLEKSFAQGYDYYCGYCDKKYTKMELSPYMR